MYTLAWALCFFARCAAGGYCGPFMLERAAELVETALYEQAPRSWSGTVGDSVSWRLAPCIWPDSLDLADGRAIRTLREGWLLVRYARRDGADAWEVYRDPRDYEIGSVSCTRCWTLTILTDDGTGSYRYTVDRADPMPHERRRSLAGELYSVLPWRCQ